MQQHIHEKHIGKKKKEDLLTLKNLKRQKSGARAFFISLGLWLSDDTYPRTFRGMTFDEWLLYAWKTGYGMSKRGLDVF